MTGVFHDESSHLSDAMAYGMQAGASWNTLKPVIPDLKPKEIACASCGAAAGEPCNKGRDPRTNKLRHRGHHFRRKHDAQLVTEAARALNPG